MLVSTKEKQQQNPPAELECKVNDEQKWKDIAEEEFEVSSSYSPIDSYSPRFLKIN